MWQSRKLCGKNVACIHYNAFYGIIIPQNMKKYGGFIYDEQTDLYR